MLDSTPNSPSLFLKCIRVYNMLSTITKPKVLHCVLSGLQFGPELEKQLLVAHLLATEVKRLAAKQEAQNLK